MFSRVWHEFLVFARLTLVKYFPAYSAGWRILLRVKGGSRILKWGWICQRNQILFQYLTEKKKKKERRGLRKRGVKIQPFHLPWIRACEYIVGLRFPSLGTCYALSRACPGLKFFLFWVLVLFVCCKWPERSLLFCLPASDGANTRRALCPRYTVHSPDSHWVSVQLCTWLQWQTSRDPAGAADIHRWPHPKRAHRH